MTSNAEDAVQAMNPVLVQPGEQTGGDEEQKPPELASGGDLTPTPSYVDVTTGVTTGMSTNDIQEEPEEEQEQGHDAFGRFYGGPVIPEVSREELAVVLAALAHGQAQGANGSVVKKVDGGVYAQFNRPNEDGHLHLYLVVPETFQLETFKPAKE